MRTPRPIFYVTFLAILTFSLGVWMAQKWDRYELEFRCQNNMNAHEDTLEYYCVSTEFLDELDRTKFI